jgi:hypothetical protein
MVLMAYRFSAVRLNYAYVMVPNRPGQEHGFTDELREAGVNFPA